jgi:hypothetical protein
LFFECELAGEAPNTPADSFLIMSLAPSMLAGSPIHVEADPVSPQLLEHLDRVQDIYRAWNRSFRKVPIHARVEAPSAPSGEVLSTYSGGIDSLYTLHRHKCELTGGMLIAGFDMQPDSPELAEARQRNAAFLATHRLSLSVVVTNQRAWGHHFRVYRPFAYSGYVAAAGLLLGASRLLIASGYPYGHSPTDGSEPYLDPLWSNGRTSVMQTGSDAWRTEKLRVIAADPDMLGALRVCLKDQNRNCGSCPKCVRTMTTLLILGCQGPFPRRLDLAEIRRQRLTDHDLHFAIDNALLADEVGEAAALDAIKASIARFDRDQILVQIDRWLLGGRLRRARRLRHNHQEGRVGFEARPDLDLGR